MDSFYELIAASISVFIAWLLKHLSPTKGSRKKAAQENFELTEKLFEKKHLKDLHDIQLSIGFETLYEKQADARVVRFLFGQSDANRLCRDYVRGERFLKPEFEQDRCTNIRLLPDLQVQRTLSRKKIIFFLGYYMSAFLFILPLMLLSHLAQLWKVSPIQTVLVACAWSLAWGTFAYANLQNLLALNAAEYVNNTLNPPEDETEA